MARAREGRETFVVGKTPASWLDCAELASAHSPHRCRGLVVVTKLPRAPDLLLQPSPFLPPFVLPGTEWVDPEDPTVIAENELLGAAAAIEAAAKKLEQLKPRAKPKVSPAPSFFLTLLMAESSPPSALSYFAFVSATFVSSLQEADESLNFEEQILEAAKSIAAATSALVKAASAAQRELVAQGKVSTWIPRSMGTAAALLSTPAL